MRTWSGIGSQLLAVLVLLAGSIGFSKAEDVDWKKKALALNQITGDLPIKGQLLELLRDKAGTQKLLAEAVKLAKEKNQPFNLNATLILARSAQLLKEYDASLIFFRLYTDQSAKLQSSSRLIEAYSGVIQLLYDNKQYAECEKACRDFLEQSGDDDENVKDAVKRRRVRAIMKLGEADRANRILDKMIEDNPKDWLNLELRGQLLREQEKYEDSIKVYLNLIEEIQNADGLSKAAREEYTKDFRYILSGLYLDLDQVDKGTDQLQILLKQEPDNATYNNDLGYIWADHDKNLDESEKMIRKAIALDRKTRKEEADLLLPDEDKDNPAYLDSLGWVLYKKKMYKEAKPYLEEAIKDKDLIDVTLYDHLGDVHWALGEKKDALDIWKKALELPGTTKRDKARKAEIAKKVKMVE